MDDNFSGFIPHDSGNPIEHHEFNPIYTENRKSMAPLVFLIVLLIILGLGGYLYFKGLIPANIFNLNF